jgi:hypothetical protein
MERLCNANKLFYYHNYSTYLDIKRLVLDTFTQLRKLGIIARSNFSCCQNCGCSEISLSFYDFSPAKKEKTKGYVFWHHQDEDHFKDNGKLYLSYGQMTENGKTFGNALEVGKLIVEHLEKQGLKVEWNGNTDTRILVEGLK